MAHRVINAAQQNVLGHLQHPTNRRMPKYSSSSIMMLDTKQRHEHGIHHIPWSFEQQRAGRQAVERPGRPA